MVTQPVQTLVARTRGDLAKLKAERAKALDDLAHRHRAESPDQVVTLQQEVETVEEAGCQGKEEVRRLQEIVAREQQKTLSQHECHVEQHFKSVPSIRRRANTAGKTAAVVEERLQAIYARRSSPG